MRIINSFSNILEQAIINVITPIHCKVESTTLHAEKNSNTPQAASVQLISIVMYLSMRDIALITVLSSSHGKDEVGADQYMTIQMDSVERVISKGDPFMKVISFKMFQNQSQLLHSLMEKGIFANTSEALRIASFEYLNKLICAESEQKPEKTNNNSLDIQSFNSDSIKNEKSAISCKFPIKFLTSIDLLVQKGLFASRTDFFRQAINNLIIDDNKCLLPQVMHDF